MHLNVRRPNEFAGCQAKLAFDTNYRDKLMQHKKAATEPKKNEGSESRDRMGARTLVTKVRTKGLFTIDTDVQRVIKHSADFSAQDFKNLV